MRGDGMQCAGGGRFVGLAGIFIGVVFVVAVLSNIIVLMFGCVTPAQVAELRTRNEARRDGFLKKNGQLLEP
jgi:hypothetical protein